MKRPTRLFFRALIRGVLLASLASMLCSACAATRSITASPEDYAAYRRVRLTSGFAERLGAAWKYLETQPAGAWRPEVEHWFERGSHRYLTRSWNHIARLQAYLDQVPNAPGTERVEQRVGELIRIKANLLHDNQRFLLEQQQREAQFRNAKESRSAFVRDVVNWAQVLGELQDFGKPPAEWSRELRTAFFEQSPAGRCEGRHCVKRVLHGFEMPAQNGLETRAPTLTIALLLDEEGHLAAVELGAEELFTYFSEATTVQAVPPDDLQARAEAIGTSTRLLSFAIGSGFQDPSCERNAVSPVLWARECDGRAAFLIAAEREEEYDRLVIMPSPHGRGSVPE